ncbi:MAG: cupin domain-containing protein [Vulcanimicrobiota bacterium]
MRFVVVVALLAMVLCSWSVFACAETGRSYIFTDDRSLPRDYHTADPVVPVKPAILAEDSTEWEDVGDGARRKVFFNDRLTMVLLQIDRSVKPDEALVCHYHAHDQTTYVLEGKLNVKVGDEVREIGPGGCYIVPSNVHHGIVTMTPRVVIMDVFTPTREDFRPKDVKSSGE